MKINGRHRAQIESGLYEVHATLHVAQHLVAYGEACWAQVCSPEPRGDWRGMHSWVRGVSLREGRLQHRVTFLC
jgi:hypothetical protein